MPAALRNRQQQILCEVLRQVPPEAPTLCEGWDAHDLAVHLWLLKHEPLAWAGVAVPALAGVTTRRADAVRRRWRYRQLVDRLANDPGGIACMPLDAQEGHRHALGEYWVHTQDVALPNNASQPAPSADLQDALWLRVQVAARFLQRRTHSGLVLERPDGRYAQVTSGEPTTIVCGEPTQLMLWVYGRLGWCDVAVRDAWRMSRR